jgi:hypothetical protein
MDENDAMKDEELLAILSEMRAESREHFDQMRRHFEVMAEDSGRHTQFLAESLSHLGVKLDGLDLKVRETGAEPRVPHEIP